MSNETLTQQITSMVTSIMEDDPAYFLVSVRITPGNNIKLFIDGESGITIEKCVSINRSLYKQIEEQGIFPNGDFSLEVSSPGLDEPLKLHRQYLKNIGRNVEVLLNDGTRTEGKLVEVTDSGISVEELKGKKKEVIKHTFLFENIKSTTIQVVF